MAEPSQPPPSTGTVAMAAAAGGFGGAILGAIAATALMGDGSDNGGQSHVEPATPTEEVRLARE